MNRVSRITVGVVSESTHRTADLLDSFAYAMRGVTPESDTLAANIWLALADESDADESDEFADASDELESLLDAAFNMLDSLAPEGLRFGAHDGDGACFGFWPDWETVDEFPLVDDSDGARALGETCKSVNDHGNVTVYAADGSVIWDCV